MVAGLKSYKDQKLQTVMQQSQKVAGKAAIGGPFRLIDQDGKVFTDKNLLGEFTLLYFGFTHCPDICPEELEKLAEAVDMLEKSTGVALRIVFISVDPERDTPAMVKAYIKEFHPRMVGLTGDVESVKNTSKAYRVYYNRTGEAGDKDYLVGVGAWWFRVRVRARTAWWVLPWHHLRIMPACTWPACIHGTPDVTTSTSCMQTLIYGILDSHAVYAYTTYLICMHILDSKCACIYSYTDIRHT